MQRTSGMIRMKKATGIVIVLVAAAIFLSFTPSLLWCQLYGPVGELGASGFHDPVHNSYVVIYWRHDLDPSNRKYGDSTSVWGRRIDYQGKPLGSDFLIAAPIPPVYIYGTMVAYDAVSRRGLLTWVLEDQKAGTAVIRGQMVNADGTLYGKDFLISDPGRIINYGYSIAFDRINQRYLVLFTGGDYGSTPLGQLVNADGTLYGQNFTALAGPALYNDVNGKFIIPYIDGPVGDEQTHTIYGQVMNPDGTLQGQKFLISEVPYLTGGGASFGGGDQKFLFVWGSNLTGKYVYDIHGRIMNADGTPYGNAFLVAPPEGLRGSLRAGYDGVYRRYLVAWLNNRDIPDTYGWARWSIYGRFVRSDGTVDEGTFAIAQGGESPLHGTDFLLNQSITYNSTCANFLVTYEKDPWYVAPHKLQHRIVGLCRETNLIAPQAGDVVPVGAAYTILYRGGKNAHHYALQYSVDGGATWRAIARDVTATDTTWNVPVFSTTKSALMRVIAYDAKGRRIGSDTQGPFTIGAVILTSPKAGDPLSSGSTTPITWTTHTTIRPVATVQLFYTLNGGTTWKVIDRNITGNPGTYHWTLPVTRIQQNRCKVMIVLKDAKGRTLGTGLSTGLFTITP